MFASDNEGCKPGQHERTRWHEAKDAKNTLGDLDAEAATRLIAAASDIALVLDDEGTIIEVMAFGSDELGAEVRATGSAGPG